jgi:hypothetical protein
MQLSILIVNYKSSRFICDCLHSADAALLANQQIEWIVIDNCSGDDSKTYLTTLFPFIKWIDMGYNAGFARANNAGMRLALGEVVLLLNPDTLLLPGSIEACLTRFKASDHVACGVQLVHKNLLPQFSGSYFMNGGINQLLPLPYWGGLLKQLAGVLKTEKPAIITATAEQNLDWISGAFLMVKKLAIENAGMMDEDFFLYGEEVEWCSRLRKMGTICIYGDIKIIHLIGETIKDATNALDNSYTNLYDKKARQLILSNHVRIRKQYGIFWFLFQLLNYTWAIPFALIVSFFKHLVQLKNPFSEFENIARLFRNVLEVWKLIFTIIANKEHFYKCI